MSKFTCLACSVLFKDGDLQRIHFSSDWHRYNLKRKISDLPPLSAEEFDSRVMQARQAEQVENVDPALYCKACKKFFKTKNSHDNHLNSRKHKESLKDFLDSHVNENERESVQVSIPAAEQIKNQTIEEGEEDIDDGMDAESVGSDEWNENAENPIKENCCIFCDHQSDSLEKNLEHMSIEHSFFIPDLEYCIDIEGLVEYLAEKVGLSYICLWCNEKGKTFYSMGGVRRHMNDKGHTKMLHEGAVLAEYTPYYDYSSSYPDHEEGKDKDEEVDVQALDGDCYSMVLPSGYIIGHRSLMKYYKQHINPNRIVVKKSDKAVQNLLSHYRAIGYMAKTNEIARRAKDIHAMKRVQSRLYMRLGCKANKLQKHFREQVNF